MRIGEIRPAAGSTRPRKRRGKGAATGVGGTSGRGHKGHKARAGGSIPTWFEGGQMPIQRRLPKRGFKNINATSYQTVAVGRLAAAESGAVVDAAWLRKQRIVRRPGPIKLLAGGELKQAVTVRVDAASAGARQVVEGAGGKIELTVVKPAGPKPRKRRGRERDADSKKAAPITMGAKIEVKA